MSSDRKKLLLRIMGVLLVIRFVLVPVFQWQQQTREDIQALAGNLARAEQRISDDDAAQRIERLSERRDELRTRYPQGMDNLELQLLVNERLDTMTEEHSVSINSRAWSFSATAPTHGEVRVTLDGNIEALLGWLHAAETWQFHLEVYSLTLRQQRQQLLADVRLRQRTWPADASEPVEQEAP